MNHSQRTRLLFGLTLLAVAGVFGCASNSASTQGVGSSLLSDENEAKLGAEMAKMVVQEMGLVEDSALLKYVQAVGARVAKQSPRQDVSYTFQIVNMPEPNAFALPGGYLYVSRGLLALCNSEDELAGVLGHEIGHVTAKHASQTLTRAVIMSPVTIATSIGGSLAGIVAPRVGNLIEGVGKTTTGLVLSPHSRTQEREADRLGQELMTKAGYDPGALPRVLDSLQREEKLDAKEDSSPNRFLATHPDTEERVEQTAERAKTMTFTAQPGIAADHAAFVKQLEGLIVGRDIRDGVFVESRYYEPGRDLTMQFPEIWKTVLDKTQAAAQSPKGDAMVLLQVVGLGVDRDAIIRERLKKMRTDNAPSRRDLRGLPLWEVQATVSSSAGKMTAHVAWIVYQGNVYEIVGAAKVSRFEAYEKDLTAAINSFRPMEAADYASLREPLLTIISTPQPLTLRQLVKTFPESAWTAEQTAVFNALQPDSILSQGQPVKLALRKPLRK